ncbi:hypothetical protein QKC54_gp0901 [Megavirus baoshan]|uniref:Uncharacterized protein n=1 Tax=Megavirus baoshan TaxID=2496520 RepID=A0A3S8UXN0_9VIRU|nr:hypothetical protein QKC54_gp0901 [Megavirus baoshan]AZL89580.1 hypothetical protein Mb0171 [Megavirus baoshan]
MNKGKEKLTDAELEEEYDIKMRIERQKQMQKQMKKQMKNKMRENLFNAINNDTHYKFGSSSSSSSNNYSPQFDNNIRQNLNLFSELENKLDESRNPSNDFNPFRNMNHTHMCIYSAPKKLLELRGINDTECSIGHDGTRCYKCYALNTYGKCPYGHIKEPSNNIDSNTHSKIYEHFNIPKNTLSTGYTNSRTYDICNKCGQEKYKTYRQTQMPNYLKTYEMIVCPNNCESK